MTYEGATLSGTLWVVSRADIAAAVAVTRAEPQLHRATGTPHEIIVIGRDEIDLFWGLGKYDVIKKVDGKWHYVITEIRVG